MFEKIEYFFSNRVPPVGKFPCDDKRVFATLDCLAELGVETERIDVDKEADVFEAYHKATVGPPFLQRALFGEFRMFLPEDVFGKKLRALLLYEKKGDRRPAEVFPRMDNDEKRVIGIEEALEKYLAGLQKSRREAEEGLRRLIGGRRRPRGKQKKARGANG